MNVRLAIRRAALVTVPPISIGSTAVCASAQGEPGDTIRLSAFQAMAARRDPRTRQIPLLAAQSDLRLQSIGAERLPALTVVGLTQYQSDVTTIPFQALGGVRPPVPPHDTYDARVEAQQRLLDPTLGPRRAAERAQRAESQARVRTAIYALRESVNEAYFSAVRLQLQHDEIETSITDLQAQLRLATDRVRLGTALPSEAAMLQAELLRRRQSLAEIDASRRAALTVLGDFAGVPLRPQAVLALPDAAVEAARARAELRELRTRPEYEHFARARDLLARQEAVVSARDKPRIVAFARAGYGQPGLNQLNTRFDTYWLAGVQLQWSAWTWGTTGRDRELLALQRQVVETEEAAFRERIQRATADDLATIDRLEAVIATDDQIIDLRERIARETLRRFQEGVVTSAEYVDRQTDVLNARLTRATHRVELALARVRFLTTVGVEVR